MVDVHSRRAGALLSASLVLLLALSVRTQAQVPADAGPQPQAASDECTDTDLARAAVVRGEGLKGVRYRARDGKLATEGTVWNARDAVRLDATGSHLLLDLRKPRMIQHFVLQGDDNDWYRVEGSLDDKRYTPLWTAPQATTGQGLRTRHGSLKAARRVRYVRVVPQAGDGHYSISELRVYCKQPKQWPPTLNMPEVPKGWAAIDNPRMVLLKAYIAVAATVLLLFGYVVRWRPFAPKPRPAIPGGMLGLARVALELKDGWIAAHNVLARAWGRRTLRPRVWLELPLLLGGFGGLCAWGYTLVHAYGIAAAGCFFVWFLLRWLSGDQERPRGVVGRIAAVLVRPRWLWAALLVLVWLGAIGASVAIEVFGAWKSANLPGGWWITLVPSGGLTLLYMWLRLMAGPVAFERSADAGLAVLGILSLFAWWNFLHYHFDHYIHVWEHYHYYIGAKYGPELRYSRIYECTAVADMQDGLRSRVEKRPMRALDTDNRLRDTKQIMENPERCTKHFSEERWQAFRKDLRFFRSRFSRERWDQSQSDHGYNATPVWAIAGRLLADHGDLTWKKIEYLATIDSLLLLAMWLAVLWAFGWKPACVALIYWGCNFPARFYWNGGSFLRYDWMFWMVIGLCLLRRKRMYLGGAALTYATLLRVFPGFLVAALVLKALARMLRERRFVLSAAHSYFAAGCISAMLVLIPAGDWATDGVDAWQQFAANSQKHLSTALTNNMGLKTVLGYDPATRAKRMRNASLSDPFADWKDARGYYYEKAKPILWILVLLFCVMLARAAEREEDWAAACLGAGLVVMAVELTCYYYGFLLTYGLLWQRQRLPGIAAAALAAATCFLSLIPWNDDHFAAMSAAYALTVILVTAHAAYGRRAPNPG